MLQNLPRELFLGVLDALRDQWPTAILNIRLVNRRLHDQSWEPFARQFFYQLSFSHGLPGPTTAEQVAQHPLLAHYVRRIKFNTRSPAPVKDRLQCLELQMLAKLVHCRAVEWHEPYPITTGFLDLQFFCLLADMLRRRPLLTLTIHSIDKTQERFQALSPTDTATIALRSLTLQVSRQDGGGHHMRNTINLICPCANLQYLSITGDQGLARFAVLMARQPSIPPIAKLRLDHMELWQNNFYESSETAAGTFLSFFSRIHSTLTDLVLETVDVRRTQDIRLFFVDLQAAHLHQLRVLSTSCTGYSDNGLPFNLGHVDLNAIDVQDAHFTLEQCYSDCSVTSFDDESFPISDGSIIFAIPNAQETVMVLDLMLAVCNTLPTSMKDSSWPCNHNHDHYAAQCGRLKGHFGHRFTNVSRYMREDLHHLVIDVESCQTWQIRRR